MKAEDTEMDKETLEDMYFNPPTTFANEFVYTEVILRDIAKAQAQISFKTGIKEVLDAIHYEPDSNAFYVNPNEWQARLKDWGIE